MNGDLHGRTIADIDLNLLKPLQALLLNRLAEHGTPPRINMLVQSRLVLPLLLRTTDNLAALIQERLIDLLPAASAAAAFPTPFHTPPTYQAMWWHPMHDHDVGHRWLRNLILDVTAPLRPLLNTDQPTSPSGTFPHK